MWNILLFTSDIFESQLTLILAHIRASRQKKAPQQEKRRVTDKELVQARKKTSSTSQTLKLHGKNIFRCEASNQ